MKPSSYSFLSVFSIFMILGLSLLPQAAHSQKAIRFGIRGGYDFINQTLDKKILNASNRTGYHAGIALDLGLPLQPLGVEISALYTQQKIQTGDENYSVDNAYFLDVPVNLKYTIGVGGIGIVLSAGPYIRFNLDGGNINFHDIGETYKSQTFQAGANFGGGVNLSSHFYIGVTYYTSLTDNYKETDAHFDEVFRKRPDRMALTATYFF